jgi:hypothetical protein
VFRDFDVFGIAVSPSKADAVLVVDPDAMLPFPVAAQRFQSIARRNQEIGESVRTVENNESSERHGSDGGKFLHPLAIEEPLGLPASETPNHKRLYSSLT